jgi:hypothetical protein
MSSITLVVPRAEKESVFLQLVVQAAIHAYRDDAARIDEAKIDAVNDAGSGAFTVAA